MISTYEKRLITFKKWSHTTSIFENLVAIEFYHDSDTEYLVICSKCDLKLNIKRSSIKIHMRQSRNCSFVQNLDEIKASKIISVIALVNSTSMKSISINDIASSPQIFYLIIIDLYRKRKILLVKTEENVKIFMTSYEQRLITYNDWFHDKSSAVDMIVADFIRQFCIKNITNCSKCLIIFDNWSIDSDSLQMHFDESDCSLIQSAKKTVNETTKVAIVVQKAVEQEAVAVRKQSSKVKLNKLFKFEEFAISFNSSSTSIKSSFESIIKSDVAFVASSIFISIFISVSNTKESETEKISNYTQMTMKHEVVVANFESRLKIKFSKFFKSFKSEKFTINFNSSSISIKSKFEGVLLIANSNSISTSVAKQAVIETIKSEITNLKNIDFFDSTMQINLWKKFRISVNSASFLYHLIEFAVKYKKKSILKVFFRCFRDSALQWLKNQLKFISLNDFKLIMTKIFSSAELVANFDSVIIHSSPRFYTCLECDAQFSSISRLLIHTQKSCSKSFTCKHCEEIFTSNNKLHMHVRVHHTKLDKTLKQRFVERKSSHINLLNSSTSSITFKTMTASTKSLYLAIFMTKAQVACFITTSVNSFITSKISRETIATSSKLIAKSSRLSKSTSIISLILSATLRSMFASTRSSFLTISMTKTPVACFFTSSSSSSRISILSHTTRKIYMTMKKLFEMFAEKTRRKNRNIIQKKSIFSCFSESRQTRIKSLCQQSFKDTAMFARKQFRKRWNIIHKRVRFSMSDQTQIINYFKFADQSNSTSIKSIKFSIFSNRFSSTSRVCFSVNQDARTSHIAFETNFTSLIRSRIKNRVSIDSSKSRYLVAADVDHINKDIRVETSLTNAKKYNSIKSSIKFLISLKSFKSFKSAVSINSFNSTSRFCFSVNQIAETSQHQHIAIDETSNLETQQKLKSNIFINSFNSTSRVCSSFNQNAKISHMSSTSCRSFKFFKFAVFISSFSSTFWFSLSVNHDSVMSQMLISISSRIDFLRVLINQMIYVSINSRFRRFRQRYIAAVVAFICI